MLAQKDGAAKFKSEKYTAGPVQTHLLQYVLHIDVTKVKCLIMLHPVDGARRLERQPRYCTDLCQK